MAPSGNVLELIIEAIDRTAPGFSRVTARIAKLSQEFPVLAAAAGMAATLVVQNLVRMAQGAVDSYNEIVKIGSALDDMSRRVDLSAETLSSWEYVMETSGGTLGNLESGVTKLREKMVAAAGGSKSAAKNFEALGVSATDAYGNLKPAETLLIDISKALQGAEQDARKMAAANTLLGGQGALTSALAEGPEEIQRKLRMVKALNGELSAEFAKSSAVVADSQSLLKFAWRGLKADVAGAINWDVALATNKLAMLVATVSGHYDDLRTLTEDVREDLADSIFPDAQRLRAGADAMWAEITKLNRAGLVAIAKKFDVATTEAIFDPKSLKFVDVERTAEQIAEDLGRARKAAIEKAKRDAERDAQRAEREAERERRAAEREAERNEERIRRQQQRGKVITGRPDSTRVQIPEGPPVPDETNLDRLKKQIEELTEFTAEDFAQMAFAIGDSFGTIVGDVGNHLLGLREGPLMLGRAFKAMAASILSDLARIIARMLVARLLMKMFGAGLFGGNAGIGAGADVSAGKFAGGGIVRTASAGLTVAGVSANSMFPAVILPGSPGLDRTPVLAHGGELLVPRQRVNAVERLLNKVQTSPRQGSIPRSTRHRPKIEFPINRPFRTNEQINLRASVRESMARGERYDV